MASEFLQKQRERFSSFLNQELAKTVRETYLRLKNQAVGYLDLGKDKPMAVRRAEQSPDPRMTPAQWEAQQRLKREGLARNRRNTKIELLIASGLLIGALAIGYLGLAGDQTGTSANVDSQDDTKPLITAPAPAEAIIDLPTSLPTATEVFTATAESIVTLTPEFHFPGFTGPEFSDRTVNRLRYPRLWSVCQEITEDNGLSPKILELGQALVDKLPSGGDIYLCAGDYGQSWRAADKDGIPLWNQVQDPADPGTGIGDYHWTLAPNDIPFDAEDWKMESLSGIYQLKPGEYWQRLTIDGDGGVMAEAVVDGDGNIKGYFDPRDGEFHQVEPLPTATPIPPEATAASPVQPTPTPGGIPTGEAAATAQPEVIGPPPFGEAPQTLAQLRTSIFNVGDSQFLDNRTIKDEVFNILQEIDIAGKRVRYADQWVDLSREDAEVWVFQCRSSSDCEGSNGHVLLTSFSVEQVLSLLEPGRTYITAKETGTYSHPYLEVYIGSAP